MNETSANEPGTNDLAIRVIDTPVGELSLHASDHGLRAVLWHGELADASLLGGTVDPNATSPYLDIAEAQLTEYFDGQRQDFDVQLDPVGSPFQQTVWQVLREIPFGETITYGEQARRLGDPNKARAVGAANGRNPIPIIVPCHRVIGSNGKLTGFAGGLENKAWLLTHEFTHR